jgi:hypothetical protein
MPPRRVTLDAAEGRLAPLPPRRSSAPLPGWLDGSGVNDRRDNHYPTSSCAKSRNAKGGACWRYVTYSPWNFQRNHAPLAGRVLAAFHRPPRGGERCARQPKAVWPTRAESGARLRSSMAPEPEQWAHKSVPKLCGGHHVQGIAIGHPPSNDSRALPVVHLCSPFS